MSQPTYSLATTVVLDVTVAFALAVGWVYNKQNNIHLHTFIYPIATRYACFDDSYLSANWEHMRSVFLIRFLHSIDVYALDMICDM